MFEAIHGSAPRRAGQNLANPSGLLHGAILMLVHIGESDVAERVHNGWLRTIEDGLHTYDIYKRGHVKRESRYERVRRCGDRALRQKAKPPQARRICEGRAHGSRNPARGPPRRSKARAGVDLFIDRPDGNPDVIASAMQRFGVEGARLNDDQQIAHKGLAQRQSRHVLERSLVLPI